MKYVYIGFYLTAFFFSGCKTSERFSGSESVLVSKLKDKYSNSLSFFLTNVSNEPVQIESTEHLYIEKNEQGKWERIPYIPCACGTPCKQPAVSEIKPNESIEISWDLVARKCGNENGMRPPIKTVEEKVTDGEYRMTFNVNRQKDGMRILPEKLVVGFSLKN